MNRREIFLLTKPPQSEKMRLCFSLMEHSEDATLYLAGDGVYNLLQLDCQKIRPKMRILACEDDLEARGVPVREDVIVPENFYQLLVEEMISEGTRIYTF
ncbi:MAG: DsrH/TusB family sulfur metabolism protein [Methanothrix sp.]